METWKQVPDFPGYEVSDEGRVRSTRVSIKPRLLALSHGKPGRAGRRFERPEGSLHVSLRRDGQTFKRRVHRLVMEAFVGPRPDGLETRHIDGDHTNNHLSNLRYGTGSENSFDAMSHGTHVVLVRGKRD